MKTKNLRNPINFFNYCLLINLLLIFILSIFPPFSPLEGQLAWGHKVSKLSEIDEWIVLFFNITILPLIFLKKKNIFLKKIYSSVVLFSIPLNFFILLTILFSFLVELQNYITSIFFFISFITVFFTKKKIKRLYRFYYKNIFFNFIFLFLIIFLFSPNNFFINFLQNFSILEIYSIVISLILLILFIKTLNNNFTVSSFKVFIILFVISILFLDVSLNYDLLHAMAWISPAMSNFDFGYESVSQYGFISTFMLKIMINYLGYKIDIINLFSILTIFLHLISILLIGLIFCKISKNKLSGILYFIIFLFIATCAFANLQITPSTFSLRFLPLIVLIYYLLKSELKFNFKNIGFIVGIFFFWSFESYVWSNLIIFSLITFIYLSEKKILNFFLNIKNFIGFNIIVIISIFVFFYLKDGKILNYFDYLNLIFSYKNGWSIPPISYFVVPLVFLFAINFSLYSRYEFIVNQNLRLQKKSNIELFFLTIFVLNCFTYYVGRSTPTLFYINSWSFLIFIFYTIINFHKNIDVKILNILIIISLIFPLSVGIKNTFFLEKHRGNILLRNIINNKFDIVSITKKFISESKKSFEYKIDIDDKKSLEETANLLNKISDEKIIILISQNLNSLSNLSFYYNNKKNFLPITYDLIDAHSPNKIAKIINYIDNVKENTKILTYTNLDENRKNMHSLELLILETIMKNWKLCPIKKSRSFSLYKINRVCIRK